MVHVPMAEVTFYMTDPLPKQANSGVPEFDVKQEPLPMEVLCGLGIPISIPVHATPGGNSHGPGDGTAMLSSIRQRKRFKSQADACTWISREVDGGRVHPTGLRLSECSMTGRRRALTTGSHHQLQSAGRRRGSFCIGKRHGVVAQ